MDPKFLAFTTGSLLVPAGTTGRKITFRVENCDEVSAEQFKYVNLSEHVRAVGYLKWEV